MNPASTSTLLTWILGLPLLGAALILLAVAVQRSSRLSARAFDSFARVVALVSSGSCLVLGLLAWSAFEPGQAGFQLVHHLRWIPAFQIEYFVGIDGLSLPLLLLTVLISFLATLASMPWWSGKTELDEHHFTRKSVPGYFALLLLLQTGMTGTFCALDLFLFYVFWELVLLPMYFLIGIWGGARREYAAIKFFLYTLLGSVFMLLAIIGLFLYGPQLLVQGKLGHSFNLVELIQWSQRGGYQAGPTLFGMPFTHLAFIGLFIGFAVKIPMVPFHTWLPDAHVEAPTPISVILAGVLLKMGIYGILRINFPLLPDATRWAAHAMAVFGVVNILYAAFICLAQRDLKRLIAYSSVSHMGFCLLGMGALTLTGLDGAVLNLWTHGLISPMLFLIVGVLYDRAHHRRIDGFGGLAQMMPEFSGLLGLAFFASLGLPGLAGFVSEFTVFVGALPVYPALTAAAAISVVITAAYYLWAMQRVILGKANALYQTLADLSWRERATLYPLAALILFFGVYPRPMIELFEPALRRLLASVH